MKSKISKLTSLMIITVLVLVSTCSFVMAKNSGNGNSGGQSDATRPQNGDQIRLRTQDCDCTYDCPYNCDPDCLKTKDHKQLRIYKDQEAVETQSLIDDLEEELSEAMSEDNSEVIEEILPQLIQARIKFQERLMLNLKQETESLSEELKQHNRNNYQIEELNQLKKQLKTIDDELEEIDEILESF
ncbi:MAG: hypothetical protein AB7G87_03415 [Clostridia bacterium]